MPDVQTSCLPPQALLPALAAWAEDNGVAASLRTRQGASPQLLVFSADGTPGEDVTEDSPALLSLADTAGADVTAHTVERPTDTAPLGLARGQVQTLLDSGRDLADRAVDSGVLLLMLGGSGDSTAGTAVTATVCRREPVAVVRHEIGTEVDTWCTEVVTVRDAMFRVRGYRNGPWDVGTVHEILHILGTPELAVSVGLLSGAADRRTPVILDGPETLAAALLADVLSPGTRNRLLVPHLPPAPAARLAADRLGLTPVVDRDLGVRRGGAALIALSLLRAGVQVADPADGQEAGTRTWFHP